MRFTYRSVLIAILLTALFTVPTRAAAPSTADILSFDIHPVAPPTPALKYRLLFDPVDRFHGNAALTYMQATMFIEPEQDKLRETCIDDLTNKNDKAFHEYAMQLVAQAGKIFDELDVAGRREHCDWESPLRERGVLALLPHLNRLRQLAGITRIRATLELRDGKVDDSLVTLRLGYELARKTGTEPVLVSGLVALGIEQEMNMALAELMSRPECPNLYWSLARLPRPMVSFAHSMQGERFFMGSSLPGLDKVRAGEVLAPDQYKQLLKQSAIVLAPMGPDWKPTATAPSDADIDAAIMNALPAAQAYWADSRRAPPPDVQKLEPYRVVVTHFWEQYDALADEQCKLVELPYPVMVEKLRELGARLQQVRRDTPKNPFLEFIPSLDKAAIRYARADRQIAAFMAVEAIRTHAAANGGKLPDKLEQIAETPVPLNPVTGQPFEYRREGESAVISDATLSDFPLEYTVRVRK
jgi:hypothetical protein